VAFSATPRCSAATAAGRRPAAPELPSGPTSSTGAPLFLALKG